MHSRAVMVVSYRNELCMDTTNGSTIASEDLKQLVCGPVEQHAFLTSENADECGKNRL